MRLVPARSLHTRQHHAHGQGEYTFLQSVFIVLYCSQLMRDSRNTFELLSSVIDRSYRKRTGMCLWLCVDRVTESQQVCERVACYVNMSGTLIIARLRVVCGPL